MLLFFFVLIFPLFSLCSCTEEDGANSPIDEGDAVTGTCVDNSTCEAGFLCLNGDCVVDNTEFPADIVEDAYGILEDVDEPPFIDDTLEAEDSGEGPGIPDATVADQTGNDDVTEPVDDTTIADAEELPPIPDVEEATDSGTTTEEDTGDESGSEDTVEEVEDTGNGNPDEGDLESCQDACAAADLVCTQPCGGSPLCLAECAAAYTECNDDCNATFGG